MTRTDSPPRIPLDEREMLALIRMLDHRPPGDEHREFREDFRRAVERILGIFVWLGRTRVYLPRRMWHLAEGPGADGLWVASEAGRARVGDYRVHRKIDLGPLTVASDYNYPDVVWIVSSGFEYPNLMQQPVVATPAEWSPKAEL